MNKNTCLFCKSSTNSFLSIEHIFPESLGNKEKILPKGVVCDNCNNGPLALIDNALLEFDPILFFRTYHGIKSKDGKIPVAKFSTMSIENTGKNHLNIKLDNMNKKYLEKTQDGFRLHWKGKKVITSNNVKLVARALYKIALELLYLDHGSNFAPSNRFDEVREIILGNKDFHGYLLMSTNTEPAISGMRYMFPQKDINNPAIFCFNYMLIRITFDMEIRVNQINEYLKIPEIKAIEF